MHQEVELKFSVDDPARLRDCLSALGARYDGRFHEENFFCDDRAGTLRTQRAVLRLRRSVGLDGEQRAIEHRVTYKEPVADPQFKVRTELEVIVDDLEATRLILERLGYAVRFRYAKEREVWHLDGVLVTLDTLPFGHFSELEGSPDAIRAVAARLDFDLAQGITKSYLTLLAEHKQRGRFDA